MRKNTAPRQCLVCWMHVWPQDVQDALDAPTSTLELCDENLPLLGWSNQYLPRSLVHLQGAETVAALDNSHRIGLSGHIRRFGFSDLAALP